MSGKVVEIVRQLAEPICQELQFELVAVEYVREGGRNILRLFIDKPGGITIDDCELLSRQIDPLLDEADPIESSYHLEVSSPGLDRPLQKAEDFIRFAGRQARVRTYGPLNGRRNFQGELLGWRDGFILLKQDEQEVEIPFDQVAKAKLVPEF